MPRAIDHDERRAQLTSAALDLIDESGIDTLSVRNVARRAGCSVGSLRYYFPRQEDLILAAGQRLKADLIDPVHIPTATSQPEILEQCIQLYETYLPLDPARTRELRLLLAFLDHARFSQDLRKGFEDSWLVARSMCRWIVAAISEYPCDREGTPTLPDSLEQEAEQLHIMWDGLAFQAYVSPALLTSERVHDVVVQRLTELQTRLAPHHAAAD